MGSNDSKSEVTSSTFSDSSLSEISKLKEI